MTSPTTAPRRPRTARPKLDAVAAAAVDLAREALEDVTEPGQVGEHLRTEASGERLVTHVFECTMPGYRGWSWVVVLTRAVRAKAATVAETALLPGEDAILAPAWEPWSERLKPEDVGTDDLLPYREQDERLEQGYEATGDEDADRVALWELGLGRARVLSPEGRSEAAERWLGGEFGPRQTSSRGRRGTVPASCTSCGFLMKLSGSLRSEFGVCTNEWSPADGRVVHLDFGCGAHSETGQEADGEHEIPRGGGVIVDELDVEVVAEDDAGAGETQDDAAAGESTRSDAEAGGSVEATADAGTEATADAAADAQTAADEAGDTTTADEATAEDATAETPTAEVRTADAAAAPEAETTDAEASPEPSMAAEDQAPSEETAPATAAPVDEVPEADSPED